MPKEIMVCDQHKTPLIWTFAFSGAEYFCMAGNHAGGMLGTGSRVKATPKLLKLHALYNRRWGQLRKHIVASNFKRGSCEKCQKTDQYHNDHLTDEERRRAVMAFDKLEEYARE